MKKRNVIVPVVVVVAFFAIIFVLVNVMEKDDREEKIERNYGISHIETKVFIY